MIPNHCLKKALNTYEEEAEIVTIAKNVENAPWNTEVSILVKAPRTLDTLLSRLVLQPASASEKL